MSGELVAGGRAAVVSESARVSVRQGFLWTVAGYAVYMACQWAMLAALTRWGSLEMVGHLALALSITTPILLFTNLGMRRIYAADATSAFRFSDYLGLRIVSNAAAMLLVGLAAWVSGYRLEIVLVILAMGAAKAVESTSDILHGHFQERGRIDLGAKSTMLRGAASLAGFAVAFSATGKVVWAIVGVGAGWLGVLLFYDWRLAVRLRRPDAGDRPRATWRSWLCLANLALPLGAVALVTALKPSIPNFVIVGSLGEAALGLFAALMYFHHASNRIVSALGESATARLARLYAAGDEAAFGRIVRGMLAIALAVGMGGLVAALAAGGPILQIAYGGRFALVGGLFAAVMAAACAANLQTVLDYAMTASRHFRIQPILYGGAAALLLVLCAAWVPRWGLPGAALALGAVSILELIASAAVVRWALRRRREIAARAGGRP